MKKLIPILAMLAILSSLAFAYYGEGGYGDCPYGQDCPSTETKATGNVVSPLIIYKEEEGQVLSALNYSINKTECVAGNTFIGNYVITHLNGKKYCTLCSSELVVKDEVIQCNGNEYLLLYEVSEKKKISIWWYVGGAAVIFAGYVIIRKKIRRRKKKQ